MHQKDKNLKYVDTKNKSLKIHEKTEHKSKNKKYGGRKIQDIRGEYQLCWSRMVVEGK